MKTKNLTAIIAIVIITTLFGCKREALTNEPVVQQNSVSEKVRAWFEKQPAPLTNSIGKAIVESDFSISKPVWEKTKFYPNENIYITPVALSSKNIDAKSTVYKFLLASGQANGDISGGSYFYVMADKKDQALNSPAQNLTPDFFLLKKIPGEFSGAIMQYDLKNNIIFSKHYEEGKPTGKTDKLSYKKNDPGNISGFANPNECGGETTQVCIDWYWQTWVNGVLVYEEYLYTSCSCVVTGGGGGGGGGGAPTPQQQATAILDYMENNTINSSILLSATEQAADPNTRTIIYEWKCVKGLGYYVKSWERGEQINVKHTGAPFWNFTSFTHLNTTLEGTAIGGTVTKTELWNNPTMGLLSAHMSLGIQITCTTTVAGTPFSRIFLRTPGITVYANNSVFENPDL